MDQGIANALADIAKLSTDELKELLNATDANEKYDEIVNQTDQVKSKEAERDMLMASVRSLAEFNLSKQKDYEEQRSQLFSLVGTANELKGNIEQKASKLLELSRKTSSESTLAIISAAAAQSEEESESVAKSLLNKDIDYDTFVNQYTQKRKIAHIRRIKADRMRQEILQAH